MTDAEAATNDQVSLVTSVLSLLVLGAAAVSFVCWLWRARLNAEAFLPLRHRRSRVWVILGWFVPIVSLWFPKQVVDDVWRTSDPGRPPHESGLKFAKPTGLVTAWWVSFLAYSIGGNISLRAWLQAEDAEQFQFANTVDIALGPIGLAAAILAIVIVRRITAMQEASLGAQIG